MKDNKVSVVIPVYNAGLFLEKCLDSIRSQTYSNMEIICVDDQSTDDSHKILQQYAKEDSRMVVIQTVGQSQGAGRARNAGLKKATGNYVVFLDADDFFEPVLVERALEKAEKTNGDMVAYDIFEYNNSTGVINRPSYAIRSQYLPEQEVFSAKDVSHHLFQLFSGSVWKFLIKREFIEKNGLSFQEDVLVDDLFFTYTALVHASRITVLRDRLLYYRKQVMNSQVSCRSNQLSSVYEAYQAIVDRLKQENLYDGVRSSLLNAYLTGQYWIMDAIGDWNTYAEEYRKAREIYFPSLGVDVMNEAEIEDSFLAGWRTLILQQETDQLLVTKWEKQRGDSLFLEISHYPLQNVEQLRGKKVVLYGAGRMGKSYFVQLIYGNAGKLVLWADKNAASIGYPVSGTEQIYATEFDVVLIALLDRRLIEEVLDELIRNGVQRNQILWAGKTE